MIKFEPGKTLQEIKEEYILAALNHFEGSIYLTLCALDVSRSTVANVERKYRHLKSKKEHQTPRQEEPNTVDFLLPRGI